MWEIVFILICILLNALLAGIEISFVSVNKALLRNLAGKGDKKAERLLKLKENPERTLSTIQVGITLLASLTATIGGAAASLNIIPILHESLGISLGAAEFLAISLVVVPITYLSVVVGEITPKSLAIRNPYFFAGLGLPILKGLSRVFHPVVKLCEKSTQALLQLIPSRRSHEHDSEKDYREYDSLLTSYRRLPKRGKEYMFNLAKIQEKTLEDLLLEWKQVDYVTTDLDLDSVVEKIISTGHTRMPVVEACKVVGMINTKEVLAYSRGDEVEWKRLIRSPVKFKKGTLPLDALSILQTKRMHMGVVEGAEDKPIGIITIEEVIEEVLGEIYDEDDKGSLQRILGNRS